jgi:hypothetical protein
MRSTLASGSTTINKALVHIFGLIPLVTISCFATAMLATGKRVFAMEKVHFIIPMGPSMRAIGLKTTSRGLACLLLKMARSIVVLLIRTEWSIVKLISALLRLKHKDLVEKELPELKLI